MELGALELPAADSSAVGAIGALRLQPLVTTSLPLSRYGEGVELLRRKRAVKVCYLPWEQ